MKMEVRYEYAGIKFSNVTFGNESKSQILKTKLHRRH